MSSTPAEGQYRGEVVYLYAFDVANEIQLGRASELLSGRSAPFAIRHDQPFPKSVPIYQPLAIESPAETARLNGEPVRLLVRVYDVGVVSVTIRVEFTCDALGDLPRLLAPSLDSGQTLDAFARHRKEEVCGALSSALVRPGETIDPEAYTVFTLTQLPGERDANRWLAGREREIAALLTETPAGQLSDMQVNDVLRLRRSYQNSDLVIIDWEASLVVDLDGYAEDVLFVLELANLQLEEFRWMDLTLDRHVEGAYGDLSRRPWWLFGAIAGTLRSLRRLRVDLARLADEVTHITKFIGDWHLARVYLLARERFHLDQWRSRVEQRLGELDQLYTITRGDLYDRRMLWLEVVIVVFFAIDILILLINGR